MTKLTELLADCESHGIRLLPDSEGGLTIDAPEDALTPDRIEQIKAHKGELLAILQPSSDVHLIDVTDANAVWQAAVNRLEDDPDFTSEEIEACRAASVTWETSPVETDSDGWPVDSIDPKNMEPCPKCGSLELWQTVADNWRCPKCDPSTKSRQVSLKAARLKKTAQDRR